MNTLEQAPDFGMDMFGMDDGFDINAAFQGATQDVISDTELALEEKVRRMEVIVSEGTSEVYRDFVDLRALAAQMSHDHMLCQAAQGSEALSSFMDGHSSDDGHNHGDSSHDEHSHKNDDDEIDPKTGTKKKKKRGWFGVSA
ncbi:MAG: hypothetical protein JWO35_756 [Candidatus Saccharibacteria bacterium]|nr:hypothetical protein [Candidatus Saccharibacteria bacterium]